MHYIYQEVRVIIKPIGQVLLKRTHLVVPEPSAAYRSYTPPPFLNS